MHPGAEYTDDTIVSALCQHGSLWKEIALERPRGIEQAPSHVCAHASVYIV